ncbi:MAG: TolC family protein [bacterium]|nr:TolC family protein [bacterium]
MRKQFIYFIVLLMLTVSFVQAEDVKKELTLKEAIVHALKHNLDLQIQMKDTEISQQSVKLSKAIFDPHLSLSYSSVESSRPASSTLDGTESGTLESKTKTFSSTISQLIPFGGSISFTLQGDKETTNSTYVFKNPSYTAQGAVQFNQPLLKNFGMSTTKKDIYISINTVKISKETLKSKIIDLVYQVENAYWTLAHAYENLEVTKMALKRAQDLLKQNEIKVRVGSSAPIDLLQAKAEVARQESELISGEKNIQSYEEDLKKILNMSKEHFSIKPLDKPEVKKIDARFKSFLAEALENRPDIQQARLALKNSGINKKYYKNQLLPEVNFKATYSTHGLAGDTLDINGNIAEHIPLSTAVKEIFKQTYKYYNFGIEAKIPIFRTQVKANYRKAKVELSKSELSLRNTENTIYSEVKKVIKELETNAKLVESQKVALKVQEEKLKAEEKRQAVGITTVFLVLEAQKNYAQMQASYLQTIINYNMTVAKINKALARTFKMFDIKFENFTK